MIAEYQYDIELLYKKLYEQLFHYAKSTLRNESLAEEAVQDTFRIACMKPEEVCESPNPRGWLLLTLKFVMSNMVKCRARANRLMTYYIAEVHDQFATTTNYVDLDILYENLADTEEFKLIRGIADGESILELANQRGISVEACKKRIQRAKSFLRKKIVKFEK